MASLAKQKFLSWTSINACIKCSQFHKSFLPRFTSTSQLRFLCSKTSSQSEDSKLVPASSQDNSVQTAAESTPAPEVIPHFSGKDIRDLDEKTRAKIHSASVKLATAQSYSLINAINPRKRKEILRMDEEEYKGTYVLKDRPPLLDRRAEVEAHFFRAMAPEKFNQTDFQCFIQQDIDLSIPNIKRTLTKYRRLEEIDLQKYNPMRNQVLGNDLAAAHFLVFRKGQVKFLGQKDWITSYRKDAKPGDKEEDLPVMSFELCNLPTKYDPRYRVEAINADDVSLHYEGLANLENLNYLKWLSLRNSPHLDDWCLDRIARMFTETLEYIDISGCKLVTDKGIGTFHRCRNLKAIRVENLHHLEDLEIVSAMLEDHIPNLQVIGVDYEGKKEQLRLQGEELERKALMAAEEEEQERQGQGHHPSVNETDAILMK